MFESFHETLKQFFQQKLFFFLLKKNLVFKFLLSWQFHYHESESSLKYSYDEQWSAIGEDENIRTWLRR